MAEVVEEIAKALRGDNAPRVRELLDATPRCAHESTNPG
jgi:hypothetical protein